MRSKISEFLSDDDSMKAVVVKTDRDYSIDFFRNGKYNHTIMYVGTSLPHVENIAENFVLGLYKSIKDIEGYV